MMEGLSFLLTGLQLDAYRASRARELEAECLGTNPPEWTIPLGWDERNAKV